MFYSIIVSYSWSELILMMVTFSSQYCYGI
uniref:Uncharacterized protein n=1 Tax=Arundo donax TaxID=35708 RepID=A0A0A9F728_ARUDO